MEEIRAADDANAGSDGGIGEEGLPGAVAAKGDAEDQVLVKDGRWWSAGAEGVEEEVAW